MADKTSMPNVAERIKQYAIDHKEELRAHRAAYYQANKSKWQERGRSEAVRAHMKKYRIEKKEVCQSATKRWRAANPDKVKEIDMRRKIKGRPQKRIWDKIYRQQNPEIYKASIARAKAAKPELYMEIAVKSAMTRRARKKQVLVERVSLNNIRLRDCGLCHLCGLTVSTEEKSFDHLIPIVRHGAHAEWNLMLAHIRCNQSRGTKQILPIENKDAALKYIADRRKM